MTQIYLEKRNNHELYQALQIARKAADPYVRKVGKQERDQLEDVKGSRKFPYLQKYGAVQGKAFCLVAPAVPQAPAGAKDAAEAPVKAPMIQSAEARIATREADARAHLRTARSILVAAVAPATLALSGCGIAAGVLHLVGAVAALPVLLAGFAAATGLLSIAALVAGGFAIAAHRARRDAASLRTKMNDLNTAESAWKHAKPLVQKDAEIEAMGQAALKNKAAETVS